MGPAPNDDVSRKQGGACGHSPHHITYKICDDAADWLQGHATETAKNEGEKREREQSVECRDV